MPLSNATLAQSIADLIESDADIKAEFQAWLAGTAGGGPNSDGKYPLTDYQGTTYLVECPAQMEDDVNNNVSGALAHKNAAEAAQTAAEAAKTAAEAAQTAASGHETDAQTAQTAAEAAQTAAESAKTVAIAQATVAVNHGDYAEEWANLPYNTLVSAAAGGDQVDDYSARHWAEHAASLNPGASPQLYAQKALDEAITGAWTFSGNVTFNGYVNGALKVYEARQAAGLDLNSLKVDGIYHMHNATGAGHPAGETLAYGNLLVLDNSDVHTQVYFSRHNDGRIYTRSSNAADLSTVSWNRLWSSADFANNSANWDTAYSWGDHAGLYAPIAGYNNTNWDTAYGWGDHASAGYAPTASPTFTGTVSGTSFEFSDYGELKRLNLIDTVNGNTHFNFNSTGANYLTHKTGQFTRFRNFDGVSTYTTIAEFTDSGLDMGLKTVYNMQYVKMSAANGRGYGFWNSNPFVYGITMSSSIDGTYGGRVYGETTSDYNLYFNMASGTNRGFVFNTDGNKMFSVQPSGLYADVPQFLISQANGEGDVRLIIEADRDNVGVETDQAELWLAQDGRGVTGYFRTRDDNNIELGSSTAVGTFVTPVMSWAYNSNAVTFPGTITSGDHTIDGITLSDSNHRSGLLEMHRLGSTAWSGFMIEFSSTAHWAFMGHQTQLGLYDDTNSDWILRYSENAALELMFNGSTKLATESTGINVTGQIDIDNLCHLTDGSGGALRVTTTYGYTDVGPNNSSWAHFNTDRASFYFNKPIAINGQPKYYNKGAIPFHASTSYQSADITFSTASPSGGASGDIWFKYS